MDGILSRDELKMLLGGLGGGASDEDVKEIFRVADRDGSGFIDFNEFIEWATKPSRNEPAQDQ